MVDFMTPSERSAHMAKIRSADTKPEMRLRRALHAAGYRFRLHDRRLPGRPDLVFASRRKVVFVNGCFWHGHTCKVGSRLPKTNTAFWEEKRRRNQERDFFQRSRLQELGWAYFDVWECEIMENNLIVERVKIFLTEEKPIRDDGI
jgi:DNA mismatch endonuclease (patch repair protein)